MECIPADKLYDYLDGELKSAEEQKIVSHLSVCKRCLILAKRLEFESALIANALRSEKVTKEERERIIRTLAEKRGWKLKKPLFLRIGALFTKSPKIFVVLALLFGMFMIGYSVFMKDVNVEVYAFFSSMSDFPSTVHAETFSISASRVIFAANSVIGGILSPQFSFAFFVLYLYFALFFILTLTASTPALKVSSLTTESRK